MQLAGVRAKVREGLLGDAWREGQGAAESRGSTGASKPSKLLLQQAAEVRLVEVVPRLSYR